MLFGRLILDFGRLLLKDRDFEKIMLFGRLILVGYF